MTLDRPCRFRFRQKVKSAEQKQKLSEAARSAEATLREDAARQKKSQWESDLKVSCCLRTGT